MFDSRRRRLLILSSCSASMLSLGLSKAARAISLASKAAPTATQNPSEWMDKWMDVWKSNSKEVDGVLYLGRFADPTYFLTKRISWKPNANQDVKLPKISVPIGFVTDFASIPRLFWSLLRPDGNYAYAAVIHDFLYWTQLTTRENSDMIFKLAMGDFKIPKTEADAIYAAVRAGGGKAWSDNARLKRRGERRILKIVPTNPVTYWPDYKKDPAVFVK